MARLGDRDRKSTLLRGLAAVALASLWTAGGPRSVAAQATPSSSAPAPARVIGTVSSVESGTVRIKPDKAEGVAEFTVTLDAAAKVLQLAPGSTDLKTAEPAQVSDITVGDRVLAVGSAGSAPDQINARRLVLMKSSAIAQRNEATAAEWQRGGGGIVTAVDPAQNSLVVTAGAHHLTIHTSGKTMFRRYSGGSVRFSDAAKSTFGEIHTGDQLRVRGTHSDDGASVEAEEIISGTFEHVSGVILSFDPATRQLTLKDLRTKRLVTVELSDNSSIRTLPPEVAARVATQGTGSGNADKGGTPRGTGTAPQVPAAGAAPGTAETQRRPDLNQVVAGLPDTPPSDLHKGTAVMVVGMSKGSPDHVIAVTLLAGVEPILAAHPNGDSDSTLSPWNLGSAPEGGS